MGSERLKSYTSDFPIQRFLKEFLNFHVISQIIMKIIEFYPNFPNDFQNFEH